MNYFIALLNEVIGSRGGGVSCSLPNEIYYTKSRIELNLCKILEFLSTKF